MLTSCICASLTDGMIIILESYVRSRTFVKLHAFDAFRQIKLIQVIEGHQMAISSKNIHFSIEHHHALSISCTGFFTDDETMSIIIDDLLAKFFMSSLLIANCF